MGDKGWDSIYVFSVIGISGFNLDKIKGIMKKDVLTITIDMNNGKENATAYGCDMTYDYVKINALYTT